MFGFYAIKIASNNNAIKKRYGPALLEKWSHLALKLVTTEPKGICLCALKGIYMCLSLKDPPIMGQ